MKIIEFKQPALPITQIEVGQVFQDGNFIAMRIKPPHDMQVKAIDLRTGQVLYIDHSLYVQPRPNAVLILNPGK